MKQQIRLTEAQLQQIVEECATQIINEGAGLDFIRGTFKGLRDINKANREDRRASKEAQKDAENKQKAFDDYMRMAEKDIQTIQAILQHYQGKPNNSNIIDKGNRLIGAIRPKNGKYADSRSYYQGQQDELTKAKEKASAAAEAAKTNKEMRRKNLQTGISNVLSGKTSATPEQQYGQVGE